MKSRWFSTFTLIGILLLALGLGGLIMQHAGTHFVFDPGQPPPAHGIDPTPWYYLIVGVLMVLNGLIAPALLPEEAAAKPVPARTESPSTSTGREAVATSAENIGE